MTSGLARYGTLCDIRNGSISDGLVLKMPLKRRALGTSSNPIRKTNMTETEKSVKQKPPAQPIRPIKAVAAPRGSHAKTINHHFPTSNARLSLERWQ
jgi:hypothetical protein